jgi:UDP-GlcNAc:undecaprenyl-phosphate GlcNAc-1-phosphate transferase
VGLSNAVNLIDGVDGLAGGVSVLAILFYAIIFITLSDTGAVSLLCLCLAASVLGFLVFNLPVHREKAVDDCGKTEEVFRAKIIMGDGGSQFLGCTIAILPLIGRGGTVSESIPLFYAAALLLIPILDTTSAVWRRLREGRSIFSPDKAHIHHKLMNLGLGAWGVDGVLYSLQALLGILVLLSVHIREMSYFFLGTAYAAGISFFVVIHFLNRKALAERPPLPLLAGKMTP